jgi:1,4-alpha-glucan branching enzyme
MNGRARLVPCRAGSTYARMVSADWLNDAVFYEIYPQSFADSDGDGIGDLPGATARLDHLADLGVDAVWFNPCFASPFGDAGYDVSDYLRIAPRYGTNDDMVRFVEEAGRRGIRVVFDLVAGHTSVEHEWFRRSAATPATTGTSGPTAPGRASSRAPAPAPVTT